MTEWTSRGKAVLICSMGGFYVLVREEIRQPPHKQMDHGREKPSLHGRLGRLAELGFSLQFVGLVVYEEKVAKTEIERDDGNVSGGECETAAALLLLQSVAHDGSLLGRQEPA